MNRLSPEKRQQILAALVEGNSIRATGRMAGVSRNTVLKLLTDMGVVCSTFLDRAMRDLPCERIQCDEIWSFVYAKQKNVPVEKRKGGGDGVTGGGLRPDNKLLPDYPVGGRGVIEAHQFIR